MEASNYKQLYKSYKKKYLQLKGGSLKQSSGIPNSATIDLSLTVGRYYELRNFLNSNNTIFVNTKSSTDKSAHDDMYYGYYNSESNTIKSLEMYKMGIFNIQDYYDYVQGTENEKIQEIGGETIKLYKITRNANFSIHIFLRKMETFSIIEMKQFLLLIEMESVNIEFTKVPFYSIFYDSSGIRKPESKILIDMIQGKYKVASSKFDNEDLYKLYINHLLILDYEEELKNKHKLEFITHGYSDRWIIPE